ncbi:S8 family serine peptidase [Dactylosporangium sp. NPDC005572]|uniref:S8 family serine peptidase n=1 Tax=Dactylosporangium sp. NPDC005572 TaxID=3156889 RepID=UPI0033B77CE4
MRYLAAALVIPLMWLTVVGTARADVPAGLARQVIPQNPSPREPVEGFVKYYVVRDVGGGRAESLWDIAERLLGAGERQLSIIELNQGRPQPDGSAMTDPTEIHPGWILVLPWDAYGDGVRYGPLPVLSPAQASSTLAPTAPPSLAPPATKANCGSTPSAPSAAGISWAQLRVAPNAAWGRTKGHGVTVAVIDSGVDATVPALTGRVRPGADATSAAGRGDTDCLGRGTALAAILAAQPGDGGGFAGVAPEATVLPIRITLTAGTAKGDEVVRAVQLAVTNGARVIMIPAAAELSAQQADAVFHTASTYDAVVVLAAPSSGPILTGGPRDGVLRVGASGADDEPAYPYPAGAVDVLAPGVRVASIGLGGAGQIEGSGTAFAVPFVAGLVALVRSAQPQLPAAAVAEKITDTADLDGADRPAPRYGWGVIDAGAAVDHAPVDQDEPWGMATAPAQPHRLVGLVIALTGVLGLIVLGAHFWRTRRRHAPVPRE